MRPGSVGPFAVDVLLSAFDELTDSIYNQLMAQTRFKLLFDSLKANVDANSGQLSWDVSNTLPLLENIFRKDPDGQAILYQFASVLKAECAQLGLASATSVFVKLGNASGSDFARVLANFDAVKTSLDANADPMKGTSADDVLLGWSDSNIMSGGAGNDVIYAMGGNDNLQGDAGDDQLFGMTGDDSLWGGDGNDYLSGDSGNDNLYGGTGKDYLEGGAGNDYLSGYIGDDVYVFNRGYGIDIIDDDDTTLGNRDSVRFGAGITPSDIAIAREGYDLVLSLKNSQDKLSIVNFGNKRVAIFE